MGRSIENAQKRLAEELMSRTGISGVGIGADRGKPCLRVYASRTEAKRVPKRFEGHRVVVVESDGFRAQGPATGGDA